MGKEGPIVTYLSRLIQVRNELGGVGEIVPSTDLMSLSLHELHKSWKSF